MRRPTDRIDPEAVLADVEAYRHGEAAAGERLAETLRPVLHDAAASFLGPDDGDVDDVVQDATLSTLGYFMGDAEFRGDPVRLAVTIARNRCRDLHRWRRVRPGTEITGMADWLASDDASPLDELLDEERAALVRQAFAALSDACRNLLHAMYVAATPTEMLRDRLGLSTVQGVYYRRTVCIDQAKMFLQTRLRDRSRSGRVGGNSP